MREAGFGVDDHNEPAPENIPDSAKSGTKPAFDKQLNKHWEALISSPTCTFPKTLDLDHCYIFFWWTKRKKVKSKSAFLYFLYFYLNQVVLLCRSVHFSFAVLIKEWIGLQQVDLLERVSEEVDTPPTLPAQNGHNNNNMDQTVCRPPRRNKHE